MVSMLVDIQASWIGRVDDLLRIGLPDWRGRLCAAAIGRTPGEIADSACGLS